MADNVVQSLVEQGRAVIQPAGQDHDSRLHALAIKTRDVLLAAKRNAHGLLAGDVPVLDVHVTPNVLVRAVAAFSALMLRWEARGGSVSLEIAPGATRSTRTTFAIGPDGFGVHLAENLDEKKPLTDPTRFTGNLAFHITGDEKYDFRRRWSDTKSQRLEKLIPPLVETLMNAIAVKRQERLDAECVTRQTSKVTALQQAANRDASKEFYWRQELMQQVDRFHDAQRIKAYLEAVKLAVATGRTRPVNPEQFSQWLEWSTRFTDTIDPIARGPLPEARPVERQNLPIAELDLTSATHSVIETLAIPDTDTLWKQTEDVVREACHGRFGRVWNEITRVLEGLGYDVSKRKQTSDWY